MAKNVNLKARVYYLTLAFFLFVLELLIEKYAFNNFIRYYLGDYLVVILIYAVLMAIINVSYTKVAFCVLVFSYVIEFLQWLNIIAFFNLKKSRWVDVTIGTTFSWIDVLCYTLGFVTLIGVEFLIKKKREVKQ